MRQRGFSLIELMIAMLFLCIGFFGYVALHSRLLHSGQRLEEREKIRAATDLFAGIEIARVTLGFERSITHTMYPVLPEVPNLHPVDTQVGSRDRTWQQYYPVEYTEGLENTLQLSAYVLAKPYHHDWENR